MAIKPMTETEVLAFLDDCGGKLTLTDVNGPAARELATKGLLTITKTTRKVGQMGVVIGYLITRAR